MSGSLQVIGGGGQTWLASTANNALAVNQSLMTISGFFQVLSYGTGSQAEIFTATNDQGFNLQLIGVFNAYAIKLKGANSTLVYSTTSIPLNVGTHFMLVLNATGTSYIYINGIVVASASNIGKTQNVASGIMFGWDLASAAGNVLLKDFAIWSGTALPQSSAVNLRDGTTTPLTEPTPATSYWSLQGTAGTNPTASAAGLLDQIGTNHFTILPGSGGATTNATYSPTPLVFVAPLTVAAAYVSRAGMFFFLMGTNPASGTVVPVYPTSIPGTPTIKVNGVTATLQGPFWSSTTFVDPWIAYQIVGGVLSTDVVTWSTPDAWVLVAIGNARDESGTATNYLGSYEPAAYGYLNFNLPSSAKMMKVGWNGLAGVIWETTLIKNIIHKAASPATGGGFAWGNITTYDPVTDYPTGIGAANAATSDALVYFTNDQNGVDGTNFPVPEGTWTVLGDEHTPATPMLVNLTANNQFSITPSAPVPGVVDPATGFEMGRRFDFTCKYVSNPTTWNAGVKIAIQRPSHVAGPNTLYNIRMFEPGNAPQANPEQVLNGNFARMTTASPGVSTPIIRFMEALTGSDGGGSEVTAADFPAITRYGYSGVPQKPWTGAGNWPANFPTYTDSRQIPIYAVRKYDTVSASPYVYAAQNYPGTVPSNIAAYPWMWDLNALRLGYDWGFPLGPNSLSTPNVVVEFVVGDNAGNPIPHNLQTGQFVQFFGGGTPVHVINDVGTTGTASINNLNQCVFVTGLSTFCLTIGSTISPTSTKEGYVDASFGGGLTVQNVVAAFSNTQSAAYSIEDIGCTAYTLKNAIWIAVNHCLNDSGVTSLATRLYNSTPRGTPIFVEYSNEIFIGNQQYLWMNQVSTLMGLKFGEAIMQRTNEVHNIFATVFGADSVSVVRLFQPFINNLASMNDALLYAHKHSMPIDRIATAIYMDMDFSPTFKMAAASICLNEQITISGTPTRVSIAHPSNDPGSGNNSISTVLTHYVANTLMPMAAYQDLCRHHIKYNRQANGPTGALAVFHNAIVASGYGAGGAPSGWTYPFPKLAGYECAWSTAIPAGVSTQMAVVRAGLTHDFMYHPSFYDVSTAFIEHLQQPGPAGTVGFDAVCIEAISGQRQFSAGVATNDNSSDGQFCELWSTYIWQGQQAGTAPFTGQQYWAQDLGGDGAAHDFQNASVNGRAFLDWIGASGSNMGATALIGAVERPDAIVAGGQGPATALMSSIARNDSFAASPTPLVAPSISKVSPSRIPVNTLGSAIVNDQSITLLLVGIATSWTSGSTVTVTNSVTGTTTVTKGTWTRITATTATLVVTTGLGSGTWTLTIDGLVSPTLTVGKRRGGYFGHVRIRRRPA